jgi:hypothetical protein
MKTKLKNMEIMMEFIPALHELKSLRTGTKIAHNAVRTEKTCVDALKAYDEARLTALKQVCQKDDKGEPLTKDGQYVFETDEIKLGIEKDIKALADTDVEVEIWPLHISEFDHMKEMSGSLLEKLLKYGFIFEQLTPLKKT